MYMIPNYIFFFDSFEIDLLHNLQMSLEITINIGTQMERTRLNQIELCRIILHII